MANQFTKEMGRELVACIAFCLRSDGPRRLLGWFDLSDTDKEALLKMLKSLFGDGIELDMPGLRKMVETFMDLTDPATVLDRDRDSWASVANGKSKVQQLKLDATGRRIWYESLREEGDTEWKETGTEPPADEQYYLTKLRKVGKLTLGHLKVLEDRWKKGEKMIELYNSFMKIANTTGPGQTILNLQLKEVQVKDVVDNIKKGNKDANTWATEISAYFNVAIAGEFQEAMKFFFPGCGYETEAKIDWGKLKKRLEDNDITAVKLVSDEIKPANEMAEVNSTLKILGETMLRVNNLGEEPVETEKERKENQRRKEVREGFKEKYEKWYQIIVADYIIDGEVAKLKATKTQLIKYGEIIKNLTGTWADIRNLDSDFVEVRKLKYKVDGKEEEIDTEDGLIEMSERIREGEEQIKEERKAKEDLQKQDVKRSEAMMKKENIVTYEGKPSFLEWAGTITKLLEQLPESTADVIVCSFVKTTINHKETFNLIQNCKTTEEIMKIMGELHATDKSVVIEAFAPVKQLKKPTTYSIAFHNGQVILRTADTLISIGIEEAIELHELDLCVDKAIHDARYQAWLEYSHAELKKLAEADEKGHPVAKTKLEEKGKYDITHSIQSFNKGRSLARNFHLLCKWIKEDMSLVQDAKDREERTSSRGYNNQKGGGNSTGSYFVQQGPGNYNKFSGNRGGQQSSGGYRRPYGTNGGAPQGPRAPGGGQVRPNKHPDCQIALDRWRALKGVGAEVKPMTKDCPLKCSHAIPFGNAGWCTTFRKYEPSMKLDVVKKNGLCRRCLSNWGPPHSPKDCRAPACSKCKGDHNMLICPAPSGSVQIHATGFVDIYKDREVFDDLDQQIMMLTTEGGEEGILTTGGDEMGQYYVGETVVEEYTEDDIIFDDPDEPVNHFCINFIEDTLQINTIGVFSPSQETSIDNHETEETMPEVERICSKDAMGELKSDDTKPTEQKVSGGHLMTEAPDSLRTNADSESSIKPGYKNTEGPPICKVNTIRQADQNSEPLCSEKPVQETGSKDLTGGKSECENHMEMESGDTKKEKQVKKLTWLEKMWAKVPEEGTKDWIKSVYTQETDWGDQSEMMWKQILQDGNIEPMERPPHEDNREESIECGRSTRHLIRKEPKAAETSTYYTEFKIKEQRYPSYIENKDYYLLNKRTAKDDLEKELYNRMVKAAVKINKIFPSVRGMTDAVCVVGESKHPNSEMSVDDKGTWVTCLFDNGAEAGTHTQTLDEAVELEKLEERSMTLNTVNGAIKKIFEIKKIKLATERKNPDRDIVHALSSAQVDQIGIQKGHMKAYVNIVSFLLQMTPKLKRHFMKQCSDNQKEIQLILGQKGGSMLMHEVIPEQLGLRQHWLLPNLRIFKNPLTQNLILAGELGIEGRLVDEDYPTLYPTKQEFDKLKRKLADGEDISDELGENLMAKQFVPNEFNNSAYYYQEVESSARSASVRTVNDPYAEVTLNSEEEIQGAMREARISDSLNNIWEETCNNYMIDMTNMEEERVRESLVAEQEDTNIMFNNQDCENLKRFMESEADFSFEAKCERCRKRDCEDCNMLKNRYSAEDSKVFRELWNNVTLVEEEGKTRVQVKYLYRHDPHETFKAENSNLDEAKRRTDSLIRKLKKEGKMESFKEQIASKIELGTLREVPKEEWEQLLKGTHNFCYLSMVSNENSQSTGSRLINDTLTSNREGASFSLENKVPSSNIGDSYSSLINFRLYRHGYSSDISKCYLRVKVDELTSRLRLCYWYADPENMENPVIYTRTTMDFGDSIAALVIRIIQLKFLMAATRMELVKEVLLKGAYADNYNSSFRTIEEYIKVRDEMNRIHDSIGLPLKGTYTDVGTDPEILQKLAKENEESPTYTFLGLTWDLLHNTLLPNSYFNLEKKKKGVQGAKKLMDMTVTDFAEPSFTWGLTRRVISRITAQAYSRLGAMLAPVIMNLKICVSRACEIMGPSELDIPIATKDANFARTVARVCSNLPELKNLEPFDKAIIPEGGVMTAIGSLGDGGAPGLGGNVYIGSERMVNGVKETNCNLLAMKSKVSKRTVPAHEMMSKPHQANMVKEVAKSVEFRVEIRDSQILVIMGGDSVCTACLFNPEIDIRNVLIKGAINTTKQRMKEILEILPEATIHLTWIAGDKNTADAATKLHSNPVKILNSEAYRHGPKELLAIDGVEHISYFRMDAQGETFTPLPERLIQTAKGAEDKMKNMDPTRTLSNNPIEEQENNMCITCKEEEMCGIYATTRAMEKKQAKQSVEKGKQPRVRKEIQSKGQEEKVDAENFKLQNKRKILQILRENETYKAMRKRTRKNLFDPQYDYRLAGVGFDKEACEWATSMSLRTSRMLAIGRYVVLFTQLAKGESITLEEARMEMWRKMILGSQKEKEGEQLKMFTYQMIQGVKCVELRIAEDNARDIWGTKVLPVISGDTQLGIKLIREAHERVTEGYGTIHEGITSTLAALQAGEKGVFIPYAKKHISAYMMGCAVCNAWKSWTYTAKLNDKYTRTTINATPFADVSIDMLGSIEAKTFPGSRKTYKIFPLIIKCIETAAVWAVAMEGATTQDVVKALLRLEVRYGEIKGISRDAGSNLLQGNINPLLASGENESAERRLFGLVKEYTCPTDAQFRNYSERSTGLFKRAIKDLLQVKKDKNLPALTKSSWDLILELAADVCNKLPMGKLNDDYICPGDLIRCGRNEIVVEETCSKLGQLDKMMKGLSQYYAVMNHARNEMLRANLISFVKGNIREGTGKKTIVAEIGDLVLVKTSDFTKRGMYGVITEIHGEGSATVHTKDGDMKRAIGQLCPLAGNCLSR